MLRLTVEAFAVAVAAAQLEGMTARLGLTCPVEVVAAAVPIRPLVVDLLHSASSTPQLLG